MIQAAPRRRVPCALLALAACLGATAATAQTIPAVSNAFELTAEPPLARRPAPVPPLPEAAPMAVLAPFARPRPAPLIPLYVTFVALQVADVASTRRALEAGGREANPIVSGLADSSAALLAVKAGATAGTIYLVERLWKRNRPAAVLLMAALNGVYAAIVAHNYRGHQQR